MQQGNGSADGVKTVTHEEVVRGTKAGDFVLLAVIDEALWDSGHIPGSVRVDIRDIKPGFEQWFPKDQSLVVHCRGFT